MYFLMFQEDIIGEKVLNGRSLSKDSQSFQQRLTEIQSSTLCDVKQDLAHELCSEKKIHQNSYSVLTLQTSLFEPIVTNFQFGTEELDRMVRKGGFPFKEGKTNKDFSERTVM